MLEVTRTLSRKKDKKSNLIKLNECKLIKIIRRKTKDKINKPNVQKRETVKSFTCRWFWGRVDGMRWHAISIWGRWSWVFFGGICVRCCVVFGIRWTGFSSRGLRINFLLLWWLGLNCS